MAFVDFDGTITSEETLSGALLRLNPPIPDLESTFKRMLARELSLKDGLDHLFGEIDSSRVTEFLDYIETVPVRPGFSKFLDVCKERDIPVVVISGGIDVMIENRLAPFAGRLTDVWFCHLDTSGETMRLVSPMEGDEEPVDKNAIIDSYSFERAFCVGDGFTDFGMAQRADVVFARDQLASFMTNERMPFLAWSDFSDIAAMIEDGVLDGEGVRHE
jgi:2-hydroxy-3-keto-5-methylthiopentenyl-1-phosphate phosphatase